MNENIDLTKILDGCPKGTKLYSPIFGEVQLDSIYKADYCVMVFDGMSSLHSFTYDGRYIDIFEDAECLLFPSKEQRDWSKFERFWDKPKKERFNPKIFKAFDRVLVRMPGDDNCPWIADFIRLPKFNGQKLITHTFGKNEYVIPYNDETEHLIGTTDDCPEYYKWWED